jgi:hypothetical protein
MMTFMRSAVVMLALVVTAACASPSTPVEQTGGATEFHAPVEQAGGATVFDALVEPMVRSHLAGCRGVEVHQRRGGFIAGRAAGPVVIISATISCVEQPRPHNETQAVVTTRWSTRSADGEVIANFVHTIQPPRLRCPTGDVGANIRREIMKPPPRVCDHAFAPAWEDFGLADFFVPVLAPVGAPRLGELDGHPTLLFERQGRSLELSGHVRCEPLDQDVTFELGGLRPLHLVGRLRLVEVTSRRLLGQWNEPITQALAINCGVAFRRPLHPDKMAQARSLWVQRLDEALAR